MRHLPRPLRRLAAAALAGFALWFLGLAVFVGGSLSIAGDPSVPTDAVVVLTGGRMRLDTGLGLLAAGMAKKMFVSGVNQRIDRDELLRVLGPAAGHAACCIAIGHDADNTQGNARETAIWMQQEGYRSLRLVTSWYHMRRSLLEFGQAMPQTMLIAHPVFAHPPDPGHWWDWRREGLLAIDEYDKYLVSWLRLAFPAASPAEEPRR